MNALLTTCLKSEFFIKNLSIVRILFSDSSLSYNFLISLAIARDIKKLYNTLSAYKNSSTIDKFLAKNSNLRHVVRRAFIIEKFPYSEIQDNTIGKDLMPIDMLRLKLSFFGALKFDPRSDKWLRICMFQGAPLPNELKSYDEQWVYKTNI